MTEESILKHRLEREILARREAEKISERKISELYNLNCKLENALSKQKKISNILQKRTRALGVESSKRDNLENILESSIEHAIISIDLNGEILIWNEGAHMNYGYEEDEIIGKNIRTLYPPEISRSGAVDRFLKEAFKKGKAEQVSERVRKDGSKFTVSDTLSLRCSHDNQPIGYVVISRDITQAKKLEESLKKKNQELEQFAYIVSHDLKAPLRAIMNLSSWIMDDNKDKLDSESQQHLKLLCQRVKRMSQLIDGILQYSRAGRMGLELDQVNTKKLLEEIIETEDPKHAFQMNYPNKLPNFKTAPVLLTQVLSNLISNAIKHHHRKKGTIEVNVRDAGRYYEFSVTDDGPGIDEKYFDKIFEIFQSVESKNEGELTGIGLSIVKKIVESQGGNIRVESKLGKGSAFFFTWPKQPPYINQ